MATKAVEAAVAHTRTKILDRVAGVVGSHALRGPALPEARNLQFSKLLPNDGQVRQELHNLWSSVDSLKGRVAPALSAVSPAFRENPAINYAGFDKLTKEMFADRPRAQEHLKTLQARLEEHKAADQADKLEIDPLLEDALVDAIVPVERAVFQAIQEAEQMAETSRQRVAALKEELARTNHDLANLRSLNVETEAATHPDWELHANHAIQSHDWNLIAGEEDKDAHH